MKKTYLFFLILAFQLSLDAQIVDTTIAGVRYSISMDSNVKKLTIFQFTITNTKEKPCSFHEFGFNTNKAILYNSKNEKIGYDFIVCGDFENLLIPQDSSQTFEILPIEEIPSSFVFRSKEKYAFDSLYLFYWQINNHLIGPVKYYLEPDLIVNLQNENKKIRTASSATLMNLQKNRKRLEKSKLRGKYVYENKVKYWNDCCSTEITFDFKDNQEFEYKRFEDQGCYDTNYNASGYYKIKNDTVLFLSPVDLVDSLHFFQDRELADSIFRITVKTLYDSRAIRNVDRYFNFYSSNINLDKKEIKWIYTSPSKNYIDSVLQEKIEEPMEEISFYFNKNQLSDFVTISQKELDSEASEKENENVYQLIRSSTIKTDHLKRNKNHIDLRSLYDKNKLITDEDVSHYKLIIKDDYLVSNLKYRAYIMKENKFRAISEYREFRQQGE